MKTLHTIMEIRVAIGSETVVAMEFQFRRRRWQQLQRANEQGKDPAWINLATKAQLEAQPGCPLYGVPFAIKDNIGVAGWTTTVIALDQIGFGTRVLEAREFYLRYQPSTESGISS
jgi:hypothetical protein